MYFVFYFTIVFLFFVLRGSKDIKVAKRTYICIITILLCFCSGFRHLAVGNDTYSYFMGFERIQNENLTILIDNVINSFGTVSDSSTKDLGYKVFEWIAYKCCFGSWELYQILVAFFLLSAIGRLIYRYVPNFSGYILSYAFYISLFYHYLPNSATRQTIALAFFLWAAIIWLEKGKKLIPVIMILIGSTIHKSVLIGFVPIVLMFVNNKKYFAIYASIGAVLLFVAGATLSVWMGNLINAEQYANYGRSDYYDMQSKPVMFLVQMAVMFVLGFKNNLTNGTPNVLQFVRICFCLAIVFAPLILVNPSLIRLDAYFSIWGVVFLPNIIILNYSNRQYRQLIYTILLVLTLGRPLLSGGGNFKFNWQYMELHERYGYIPNEDMYFDKKNQDVPNLS